uniref:Solute carrier family 15 member 2 n=1 Tax=Lygus hesperus TaxID=30085 RepID=A0A0A9W617_LYGHE
MSHRHETQENETPGQESQPQGDRSHGHDSHSHGSEGHVRWPLFGKISIMVEGFVYYSQYSSKVITHDLAKWFPSASIHSSIQDTLMLLAGILSLIMGYLADDVFGKYWVVMATYIFCTAAPLVAVMSINTPNLSSEMRTNIFISSIYCWFPILAVEATRVALISEQFKLPQSLRNLKLFYFVFFLNRYAGSGVAGLLMKMEQYFGGNKIQLTIRVFLLASVVISYTLLLIILKNKIRRKRVQVGVVDNVVSCIFSALWNRAFLRKKMAANAKWIDYSDAKYFKETKDSALQLVQMSLIFLPFSLFFGLNEFLDVIWMEQNDWINPDSNAFFSSLSMITIYHAVDVMLIPLFEYLIEFVAPKRCNLILTDLQLIGSAIFLLGLAYLSTTILQSHIENGNVPNSPLAATIKFYNAMDGNVSITSPFCPTAILRLGESFEISNIKPSQIPKSQSSFKFPAKISYVTLASQDYTMLEGVIGHMISYVISDDGIIKLARMKVPTSSFPVMDIVNGIPRVNFGQIYFKKLKSHSSHHHGVVTNENDEYTIDIPRMSQTQRLDLSKGDWKVQLIVGEKVEVERNVSLLPRAAYSMFICYDKNDVTSFTISSTNTAQLVTIWYGIPQIILRSLADGIGKISTYYFTYTQSPRKLRATAFGVLFFAQYSFPGIVGMLSSYWKQGLSSFILSLYTFIVFLAMVLFIYFSLKYEEI